MSTHNQLFKRKQFMIIHLSLSYRSVCKDVSLLVSDSLLTLYDTFGNAWQNLLVKHQFFVVAKQNIYNL